MERRDFIQTSALAGMALACTGSVNASETKKMLSKRIYNSGANQLSMIGFGGIVVKDVEQPHANAVVAKAVERGVNYFDVAPSYGNAEEHLGPALKPFREDVFLACKTTMRDNQGAEKELHESLKKLRTDRFDLYQLHALSKMEDLDEAAGPGGALETFTKAREQGKIRYIGFSAHSAEVALAAMDRFEFDSILFPFNFVCWHEGDFGPKVLEKAKKKNVARLALKAMAHTPWPKDADRSGFNKCWYKPTADPELARLALRFTLSLDITAAIPPGEESMFSMALDAAEKYKPLTSGEMEKVKQLASGATPIFRSNA
jgi:predicted aldo/keto reductase-like oxidoreductase